MIVPSAEFIETAKDAVDDAANERLGEVMVGQRKELRSAIGECSNDLVYGYLLGIQTARMILRGSPAVVRKGLDPETIL